MDAMDEDLAYPNMDPSQGLDFAEIATQQPAATQETGINTQLLSAQGMTEADSLDIICTLFPTTPVAFEIVQRIAQMSPQHILRNQALPRRHREVLESYESQPQQFPSPSDPQATPELTMTQTQDVSGEIALRMSSDIKDIDLGFSFGRDPRKADIVLDVGSERNIRISGMHCRIYLTDNGVVMLEDTSTNGTVVDGNWLKLRKPVHGNSVRRVIGNGAIIEIMVDDAKQKARFVVKFPDRPDEEGWQKRLQAYLSQIKRVRAAKKAKIQNLAAIVENGALEHAQLDPHESPLLTAGTMNFNHGMKWNGGERYNPIAKIGSGAFATVYRLVDVHTGADVAAKELEKRRFMKDGVLDIKIATELEVLKTSNHEHIIKFHDYYDQYPRYLYIIMECMDYGDLSQHLGTNNPLSDHDSRCVAKQMCHALSYLHDNGVAHRDIKPENILKKSAAPIWAKLADFGLSKIISQGDSAVYQTFCGTLLYCAPEVYPGYAARRRGERMETFKHRRSDPYSVAVDIWSLAAVMFHLVCGVPPYEAPGSGFGVHILEAIFNERFPQEKFDRSGTHPDWEAFLINSLQLYAAERWSARRLLKLPFFQRIPDVVEIDYQFKTAETSLAFQEDSSDEDMSNGLNSIIEEAVDEMDTSNDLDASQLSIREPELSEDDAVMSGADEIHVSHGTGLGIQGLGNGDDAGSHLADEEGSRYNLRARSGPSRQPPPPTPRKNKKRGAPQGETFTPAVTQQPGKLFGEIAESGVFGSAATTPRIVNAAQFAKPMSAAPSHQASIVSEATDIVAGNAFPRVPRQFVHHGNVAGLRGSEGDVDEFETASAESDFSVIEAGDFASVSTSMKHPRHNDEEPSSTTVKRSKYSSSSRMASRSNGQGNTLRRPETPEASMAASSEDQETPRPRKPVVASLDMVPNVFDDTSQVPPTAAVNSFPGLGGSALTSGATTSSSHGPTESVLAMPPPPARRPSVNSSRPSTPSFQASPDNPLVSALGILSPGRSSIQIEPVYITTARSEWGRAPSCTHIYKNPADTRVSKSAFTIALWDPTAGRKVTKDPSFDWSKANYYAVISTNGSRPVFINGIPITRKLHNQDKMPLGLLYSGDKITIFDDGRSGEHLHFYVHFWSGAAHQPRDREKDEFRVLLGEDSLQKAIMEVEARRSALAAKH